MKKKTKAKRVVVTGKSDADNVQLRDYFAAFAMGSIIAKHPAGEVERANAVAEAMTTALGAYAYADAMLSAREAKP